MDSTFSQAAERYGLFVIAMYWPAKLICCFSDRVFPVLPSLQHLLLQDIHLITPSHFFFPLQLAAVRKSVILGWRAVVEARWQTSDQKLTILSISGTGVPGYYWVQAIGRYVRNVVRWDGQAWNDFELTLFMDVPVNTSVLSYT